MRVWHLCTGPGNSGSDVRYMCEHVTVIKHDGLSRFVPTFGEHAKKKEKKTIMSSIIKNSHAVKCSDIVFVCSKRDLQATRYMYSSHCLEQT